MSCPLGLTPDDLSAWRDHALSPEDERRITAHTSGCPACQRTLAAHDALATALRAEQPPTPDPRNWSRLQARIAHSSSRAPAAQPRAQRPAIWGGLGAAVAVLLLSALFIHLFTQQSSLRAPVSKKPTPTIIPTPQALQAVAPTTTGMGPQLRWRNRTAPDSVVPPPGNQTDNSNIAFAPSDAQTAYICFTQYASHSNPIAIWATHDGARTWTHVSDLPAISWGPDCIINVDAHDPLRLNVVDYGLTMNSSTPAILSDISDDGGKTWRTISAGVALTSLATENGTSIAITESIAGLFDSANSQPARLIISHDDFRTWTPIDSQLISPQQSVWRVWQRPGDGALLADVGTFHPIASVGPGLPSQGYTTYTLWTSADMGMSWIPFRTPSNLTGYPGYVVAQPTGTSPWQVCGMSTPAGAFLSSTPPQSELIGCTRDGGQTWTSRPLPAFEAPCDAGCAQQNLTGPMGSMLLSDGSLVTTFFTGPIGANVVQTPSMFHIFRLRPGDVQWQDLGQRPSTAMLWINAASGGTLVSFEGGTSLDGMSGSIVGHLGGDIPNRGVLSFAQLP